MAGWGAYRRVRESESAISLSMQASGWGTVAAFILSSWENEWSLPGGRAACSRAFGSAPSRACRFAAAYRMLEGYSKRSGLWKQPQCSLWRKLCGFGQKRSLLTGCWLYDWFLVAETTSIEMWNQPSPMIGCIGSLNISCKIRRGWWKSWYSSCLGAQPSG